MGNKKIDDVMSEKITQQLREGYVIDLKKPEFDHFERAAIIRQVLDDKGWSIRQMAREYNIPKSTIEDWLLYERIEEEKYEELKKDGLTHTQIYRSLRESKDAPQKKVEIKPVDAFLQNLHRDICKYKKDPDYTERTREYADVVINDINELKSNINIKDKLRN